MKNKQLLKLAFVKSAGRYAEWLKQIRSLVKGKPDPRIRTTTSYDHVIHELESLAQKRPEFLETMRNVMVRDGRDDTRVFSKITGPSTVKLSPDGHVGLFKDHGTYFGRHSDELNRYLPPVVADDYKDPIFFAGKNKFTDHSFTQGISGNPGAAKHVKKDIYPSFAAVGPQWYRQNNKAIPSWKERDEMYFAPMVTDEYIQHLRRKFNISLP
jgi:hypothetical protein